MAIILALDISQPPRGAVGTGQAWTVPGIPEVPSQWHFLLQPFTLGGYQGSLWLPLDLPSRLSSWEISLI